MYAKSTRPRAKREVPKKRSATIDYYGARSPQFFYIGSSEKFVLIKRRGLSSKFPSTYFFRVCLVRCIKKIVSFNLNKKLRKGCGTMMVTRTDILDSIGKDFLFPNEPNLNKITIFYKKARINFSNVDFSTYAIFSCKNECSTSSKSQIFVIVVLIFLILYSVPAILINPPSDTYPDTLRTDT